MRAQKAAACLSAVPPLPNRVDPQPPSRGSAPIISADGEPANVPRSSRRLRALLPWPQTHADRGSLRSGLQRWRFPYFFLCFFLVPFSTGLFPNAQWLACRAESGRLLSRSDLQGCQGLPPPPCILTRPAWRPPPGPDRTRGEERRGENDVEGEGPLALREVFWRGRGSGQSADLWLKNCLVPWCHVEVMATRIRAAFNRLAWNPASGSQGGAAEARTF